MRIVDANLLLYASSDDLEHHEASRTWLDHALSGGDTVGLAWIALLASSGSRPRSGCSRIRCRPGTR